MTDRPPARSKPPLHYGWIMVLATIASVFVALGIGSFALGMLLPAMGAALPLSYLQMGLISTGNFLGYLVGALLAGRFIRRFGERRLIGGSLLLIVVTMAGIAMADGVVVVLLLYLGTGLGSGLAFVATASLLPHWFHSRWRGRTSGSISTGAGLAMMLAGWAVPVVNAQFGGDSWRLSWAMLAGVALLLALACLALVRNRPADLGLAPYGATDPATAPAPATTAAPRATALPAEAARALIVRLGAIYFLFGASYVVYATFIVTSLVQQHGFAEARAGQFWIWQGFFTLFCGPLLGGLSDRFGRRAGIVLALTLQGSAYLLAAWGGHPTALYLSVCLWGLSAFGVPVIIPAAAADYLGSERAIAAIGALTVAMGLGQMLGPLAAGLLAEWWGGFSPAYLAAAAAVAVAILMTLRLKPPETAA